MSTNLDLVRSIYAAWERGDFRSAEWAHPEIEFVWVDGPSPGTWAGVVGMTEALREFLSAWEDYRVVADEFRELDDQCTFVLVHNRGRGKTSGVEFGQTRQIMGAHLFRVRDGKVTKLTIYWDRDRALADLGLAPAGEAA